ncbi:GntR family transcriptional regulator [Fundicoccus sp. Sow4_H7]|uniref:GntR family transcriptional regulator n=1 Tax=Fundicoccus sp. Sow4_H7 TaxID=3438784 RepID=UPI003F9238AE
MKMKINLASEIPIYQQIRDQIILGLGRGELAYGELLPSARQLAEDLGINPMTVNKAYQTLKQEGVIVVDRRVGTKIREQQRYLLEEEYIERLDVILAEGLAKTTDDGKFRELVRKRMAKLMEGRKQK